MLRHLGFIPILVKCYQRTQKIPGFSYSQNDKTGRINVTKKKSSLFWPCIVALMATVNFKAVYKCKKEGDIVQLSLYIVLLTASLLCAWVLWLNYKNPDVWSKFLNSLLEMEEQFCSHAEENNLEIESPKAAHAVCNGILLMETVAPWLLGCGCGLMPCSAPNFLGSINPVCNIPKNSIVRVLEFVTTSLVNAIMWKAIIGTGLVVCVHILVGFLSQKIIVKLIRKNVAFDNMLYKKAQLMNTLFNQFHGGMLLCLMVSGCTEQACLMYVIFQAATIPNDAKIPLPISIWNVVLVLALFSVSLYIFGVAGSLHTLSEETLKKAGREIRNSRKGQAELKRTLKACAPMKIAFGMSNFIERVTPLKFFEYSIQRFIDLILLSK